MVEKNNTFLDSISFSSDSWRDITNNEWRKIKEDKNKLLSSINNVEKKEIFLSKISEIDNFFANNENNIYKTSENELSVLKEILITENEKISFENISYRFFVNSRSLDTYNVLCNEIWLDLRNIFNWYDKYITKNLSKVDSKIRNKIYKSIWIKVIKSLEKIYDIKNEHPNNFKDYRWVMNEAVQDELDFVNDILLPSAVIYQNKDSVNWSIYDKDAKLEELEEMFNAPVNEDWDFDEWLFSTQITFDNSIDYQANFLQLNWVENVIGVDILSDEDKKIEADVMIKYIAYVTTMLIPYAWALTSVPSDLIDVFSSAEWTIESMKLSWLIPEDFHMSKHWYDTVFWVAWLVWTAFWAQAVWKWWKFAKAFSRLYSLWLKWSEIKRRIRECELFLKNRKNIEIVETYSNWVLKIDNTESLLLKSDDELSKYFLSVIQKHPEIKEIDISSIKDKALKAKLNHIIWLNYPLLNISRLMPWQKVVDITFLWVKDLNDWISKEFVDLFNDKFKDYILINFKCHVKEPKHWRLIRSDYKHITFSLPHEKNIFQVLFWWWGNRKDLIKEIFDSISEKELLDVMKHSSKKMTRNEIRKKLLDSFDFWVWVSRVPWKKWDIVSNKIKLESFYKTEISSRVKPKWDKIELTNYNFDTTKQFSINAFKIESEIIKKFEWQTYKYDWVDYSIVKKIPSWEEIINPYLLRCVRKNKNIWNTELYSMVEEYISNINNAFDFISPVIKSKKWDAFEDINKIAESLNKWKIHISSLEKNYKWTYTANALEAVSAWKEWMRVFVDIVDMWIMNLTDFRELAKKVVSWKITSNNIWELLDAWLSVTNKFQSFVKEIEKIPWAKVSLWGDEVFIFIEWKKIEEKSDIINKITHVLNNNQLRARVSYSFDKTVNKTFDKLDSLTKINKIIEKKIEEIIVWWNTLYRVPNNLTLDINPNIVWKKDWDYDKFLENIESSIDYVKLLDVIQSMKVKSLEIWWFDNVKIYLTKKSSNEYILSIK